MIFAHGKGKLDDEQRVQDKEDMLYESLIIILFITYNLRFLNVK